MDDDELDAQIAHGGSAGWVYSQLKALRVQYGKLIDERYPRIPRRVSGYNLNHLLPNKDGRFNIARALVGSESTCVTILEAKVQLVYSYPQRVLLVLGYPSVYEAADHVPELLQYKPIGFEGIDPDLLTEEDIELSPVRCPDPEASKRMVAAIDEVGEAGDTLGGTFRVIARGVPPGLGSYVHWDRKLDGKLAQAVMSINAIKGVEFGAGFEGASRRGSEFHDQIDYEEGRFRHLTNRAGGITGGVTNGEPIDLRVAIKPISTMKKPMQSIDLRTKEKTEAHYERSDVCVVPAAGVIGEAVVALTLADAFLEKFGGDSMPELERNYRAYVESIAQ